MVYAANLSKDPTCTQLRESWGDMVVTLGDDGYYTYSRASRDGSVSPTARDDRLRNNNAGMVYVLSCVTEPADVVPPVEASTFLQEWEHSDGVRSLAYQFNRDATHGILLLENGCTSIKLLRQAAYTKADYEALLSLSLSRLPSYWPYFDSSSLPLPV